jgi:hypothetical protein
MEIYKTSDIEIVNKNIDSIIEKIELLKDKLYSKPSTDQNQKEQQVVTPKSEPKMEDVKKIVELTLNFIILKKRKVYGGFAQNKVICCKNVKDAIYVDDAVPDIDVYSPTPIEDLIELCDLLHANGYTDVIGKPAIHKETYKIFANGYNAIDLSYVPKNIYDNIPFVEIKEIRYIHPLFSMIDLYRMMSEPLFSSWRWKKIFNRLHLLQKYFPFPKINEGLPNVYNHKKDVKKGMETVLKFVKNNKNVYLFGDFAYNQFVKESKITKANKNIHETTVNIYQIVSLNYKNDAVELIKQLKLNGLNIKYAEYYPFWTYIGRSVEILCNGEVIAKIYNNLKRCCPIKKIDYDNSLVQIGSFDYVFLMEMIMTFKQKVARDGLKGKYHGIMISNLIQMREYFFVSEKKTLLDDSLFQSFISECIGEGEDLMGKFKQEMKERKIKKRLGEKLPQMFTYRPVKELKSKWIFDNTSGNIINNPKNLKLPKDL